MRSLLSAAAISLAFTLFLTPVFLRLFRTWGWGQVIRTPEDGNNPQHHQKRGTPTMGGIIFVLGTMVGYFAGTYAGGSPPTISVSVALPEGPKPRYSVSSMRPRMIPSRSG